MTSNIFKTCFGQSEQVWMDEKLVTILRFEIQSSTDFQPTILQEFHMKHRST